MAFMLQWSDDERLKMHKGMIAWFEARIRDNAAYPSSAQLWTERLHGEQRRLREFEAELARRPKSSSLQQG